MRYDLADIDTVAAAAERVRSERALAELALQAANDADDLTRYDFHSAEFDRLDDELALLNRLRADLEEWQTFEGMRRERAEYWETVL